MIDSIQQFNHKPITMNKKTIFTLAGLAAVSAAFATAPYVSVCGPDGNNIGQIERSNVERINLRTDDVEIVCKDGSAQSFDKVEISRIILMDNNVSGVSTVKAGAISLLVSRNSIGIQGASAGTAYSVAALNGSVLASGRCVEGTTDIAIDRAGAFILTIGKETFKIIKK